MPEEDVIKRVMPHSLEAEQSVLGAMIMDRDAVEAASEVLTADDFYSKQNGLIYEAIVELTADNTEVDEVTLQNRLREKGLPPEFCTTEYIESLVAMVPTSANVRSYVKIVEDKSMLRKLIRAGESIANNCYEGKEDLDTIMDDAEKRVFDLSQRRGISDYTPIRQIVLNAVAKIQEASKTKSNVTGIPTGFTDLDNTLAGLQPADMILIAARPSMGKTALALNMAEYEAFHENRCVAIFSLEMSKEQLVNRLISMESHVDAQKIRTGNLENAEWTELLYSANTIGESRLIIDDTPAITVAELRTKCRKYKAEQGLEAVFIDYLQLMTGSGSKSSSDSRQQEVSEISRQLKSLARELKVPIVALSQLSRAAESRPNHRPMLSDLRESGAIEQDADVVMFIYRDDYYNPDTDKKGIAEIIIAKQRNGPVGTVELSWQAQYTKFGNLEGGRTPSFGD
jgi:replicative DNA helicase